MTLNEMEHKAYEIAKDHGFHEDDDNPLIIPVKLMLTVSELSEAMEAHRNGVVTADPRFVIGDHPHYSPEEFEMVRGTIEEEIADAIMRLADIAEMLGMNLEWWVTHKMAYNQTRALKHGGKKY
jgi:NTP pyrophosphatase (non-canonical NTP hydrolase)